MPYSGSHQPSGLTSGTPALSRAVRNDRLRLWVIALFGAARALFFSTVFPLFNKADDFSHIHAVCNYSAESFRIQTAFSTTREPAP